MNQQLKKNPAGVIASIVTIVIVGILAIIMAGNIVENVDADEIACIQSPISGKLHWFVDAGIKWQGFGKVTKYKKRSIYKFKTSVRFNDGGHGTMMGSVQYENPLSIEQLTKIHVKFGSQSALETQLIQTIVGKAIYMTGPLMSSKESYAEKRNYLISYVEDQIANGVYKTVSKEAKIIDQMTGIEKTITVVDIVKDSSGMPARQEEAAMKEFGIRTFNFSIDNLPYDQAVEDQIKAQQAITMDVQTAIASAKKAEQNAITVAKEGEANSAKAKWEQEVIKARAVTEAQQQLEVATLEAKTAEQEKRANILRGEGEAAYKKLVMQANGALEQKLAAIVEINKNYADAIKGYTGNWVPSVVMGDGNSKSASGASDLVNLLTAKTAKDLALDLGVEGAGNTK